MYRKNVAGQNLPFVLVKASDGTALTGATVTARRSIDGGAQANATGTVSELANGQYNLALSQADTNGNNIGILLTATNAIPVHFTLVTTAADPTDAVRLGLTSLPNAAAEAAGGLYTRGTGAGQINQSTSGQIDVNAERLNNVAQSLLDLKDFADAGYDPSTNQVEGVKLTDTVTTYTGNTPQTGDAFARLGAPAGASVSADVATRASQASVDDLPTNAELATALAAADDAVLAAIAALNNLSQAQAQTAAAAALAAYDPPTHAELISEINDVQTDIATRASQASVDDLPTNAELATALANADDAVLAAIAALNNLSAAQVNAQVLDVLNVDTFGEPSGVPAATASLVDKIGWLVVLARNKLTSTATTLTLRNDADSGNIAQASQSDDGTTYTRSEWA